MASTSPLRGSRATTAPLRPSSANSATTCKSKSSVNCKSFPGTAGFDASTLRSRPLLSTNTRRSPSIPVKPSLYCRSKPVLPIKSPCEKCAKLAEFSSCSEICAT